MKNCCSTFRLCVGLLFVTNLSLLACERRAFFIDTVHLPVAIPSGSSEPLTEHFPPGAGQVFVAPVPDDDALLLEQRGPVEAVATTLGLSRLPAGARLVGWSRLPLVALEVQQLERPEEFLELWGEHLAARIQTPWTVAEVFGASWSTLPARHDLPLIETVHAQVDHDRLLLLVRLGEFERVTRQALARGGRASESLGGSTAEEPRRWVEFAAALDARVAGENELDAMVRAWIDGVPDEPSREPSVRRLLARVAPSESREEKLQFSAVRGAELALWAGIQAWHGVPGVLEFTPEEAWAETLHQHFERVSECDSTVGGDTWYGSHSSSVGGERRDALWFVDATGEHSISLVPSGTRGDSQRALESEPGTAADSFHEIAQRCGNPMRWPSRAFSEDTPLVASSAQAPAESRVPAQPGGILHEGQQLHATMGCVACHRITGTASTIGPNHATTWGAERSLMDGTTVTVVGDTGEQYIRQSILVPQAQVVEGFQTVMPSFRGTLTDEEIELLVRFIQCLSQEPPVGLVCHTR